MCIDNVCARGAAAPAAGQGGAGGDSTGAIKTRSELGESCQTRADCLAPLVCIENTCLTGFAPDASVETTLSRGKRGETCEAANDCEQGLACIGSRCLESDFDLMFVPKQCYRVQCATGMPTAARTGSPRRLHAGAVRHDEEQLRGSGCVSAAERHPSGGNLQRLLSWVKYCRCSFDCVEEQCAPVQGQYCLVDGQCTTGPGNCVNNRCVACTEDLDCATSIFRFCSRTLACSARATATVPRPGSRCVTGTCQPAAPRTSTAVCSRRARPASASTSAARPIASATS